jgi:hypothetical protein
LEIATMIAIDGEWEARPALRIGVIALLLSAGLVTAAEQRVQAANEDLQPVFTVTGTLAVLDLSAGKGMLKTDLDKPIFFKIGRPDLFERLSIGDRVTMQIDEGGRTMKVIKALPEELPEPPTPAP